MNEKISLPQAELLLKLENPTRASMEEIKKVEKLSEIEREWWKNSPAFLTTEDILRGIENGILEKVESDENVKLIIRFENPDLKDWRPYLCRDTALLLKEIGRKWRKKMSRENLPKNIILAVTSLVRSVEYQEKIIEKGKLAMSNSSHTKGQSFDIDGCGYYENDSVVNPRQSENYKDVYNQRIHQLLKELLKEMKKDNCLNYILEYENTDNQCFHITRNPDYRPVEFLEE